MRYDEATGGGTLSRVTGDGTVTVLLDDATVSNGTGWSPDGRLMYYIDTPTRRVDVFDAGEDGTVSGRRPLAVIEEGAGFPDGLTVDADGCVWVALWDGAAVRRYTPSGELDRVIELPVPRVTACAFGGPALTDLYITTARVGLTAPHPLAGSLLVVPGAGKGWPSPPSPAEPAGPQARPAALRSSAVSGGAVRAGFSGPASAATSTDGVSSTPAPRSSEVTSVTRRAMRPFPVAVYISRPTYAASHRSRADGPPWVGPG